LKEAEARLELAQHYQNPYPRMASVLAMLKLCAMLELTVVRQMNSAPGAVGKAKRQQKRQETIRKQSIPLYLQSLQVESEKTDK
jgi:hypothetical protein